MIIGDKKWKKGTVIEKLQNRRYLVRTEDGGELVRNRKHLRKQQVQTRTTSVRENLAEPSTTIEKPIPTRRKPAETAATSGKNPTEPTTTMKKTVETLVKRSRAGRTLRPPKRFNQT